MTEYFGGKKPFHRVGGELLPKQRQEEFTVRRVGGEVEITEIRAHVPCLIIVKATTKSMSEDSKKDTVVLSNNMIIILSRIETNFKNVNNNTTNLTVADTNKYITPE